MRGEYYLTSSYSCSVQVPVTMVSSVFRLKLASSSAKLKC